MRKITLFILLGIGISFLSLLVLFAIGEMVFRFYIFRRPPTIFKIAGYGQGYRLNPSFQGDFSGVFIKINNQGLRQNNDIQLIKAPQTIRIIGLGDSVAFGFGLEEPKTYLRQLENLLNKTADKKFEVINAAVSGYNTFQERQLSKNDILKFKPDIIILSFVLNDIAGDFHVSNMIYRTLAPFKAGAYSPNDLNSLEKIFYFLFRKTYTYQFMHPKLSSFWGFRSVLPRKFIGNYAEETILFYRNGYYAQKLYAQAFRKTEDELLKINDLIKKNDINLVVVIFPVEIQLENPSLRKPQENLARFCQNNSLKCLDLMSVLEKEKDKKLFNDGIGHPNQYASEIIAKTIYEYLVKNNIIKL